MEHASPLNPEILLRHEEFVLRLARTLVRGESDAEEVAQRTLASALTQPPKHGAVKAWLVRVTRNHATELHRGERRRTDRERRAARAEAVEAGTSAMERLELEHGVVRAVLALDEPYRGVVVATYYEGLAPAEIAARRGVPAGTVRSQLTRAHELLRAKLDREHGERGTWMRGLTALLVPLDAPASAAASFTVPLAIAAGIAAVVAGVFVARAALAPPADLEMAAVEPAVVPAALTPSALGASAPEPARAPDEAAALAQTTATIGFVPADDPVKLLEQTRQIKQLILERRLAVTPEERARAGIPADTATSGVVRLLERDSFGERFDLPWMRGGGTYYSFTERVHDYNRRPQITLQQDLFSGSFYGASSSLLVDLGERRLADVPASRTAPDWLDPARRFLWDIAQAEFDTDASSLSQFAAASLNEAVERGHVDEATQAEIDRIQRAPVRARLGHAYLVRCVSKGEHDVVVAVEVVAVAADQCTIAWRILDSRPVANPERVRVPVLGPGDLPPPSPELVRMDEVALRATLATVGARADQVLFDRFAPHVEARFGSLRGRPDSGLVRLVPYMSKWSELSPRQVGGAMYSFFDRSHDAREHDVLFQGLPANPTLGCAFAGYDTGSFVDLGSAPIDSVSIATIESSGDLGAFVVRTVFPGVTELPTLEPARQQALRASRDSENKAANEFNARRDKLGGANYARAVVGRTYGIRATRFGAHDVLAVVHVAAIDDQGAVIAWRLLKTWPVNEQN